MFDRLLSGDLRAPAGSFEETELRSMFEKRRHSLLFIIWVIVGLIVAWEHVYITVKYIELLVSAVLAVFLWPLVLLHVNFRIH
jgi:hypothetical protein